MRTPALIPCLLILAAGALADPSTPAASPAVTPTPESVTQAYGALPPGLQGAWLLVLQTQTAHGIALNWNLYRFGRKQEAWGLQRYERPQNTPIDALMAAAMKDQKEMVPSKSAIDALKQALPKLKLLPENQTFRIVVLRNADHFVSEAPAESKGGKFSIEILDQTAGNMVSAVQMFAKDVQDNLIKGDTHLTTITTAGLGVVPIQMSGRFKMYRLE